MADEQQGDQEPEQELHRFGERHPQGPAPIQRDEAEDWMREQRRVQHERAERIAPQRGEPPAPGLRGAHGDQPERVVAEMRDEVRGEHEA